MTTTTTTNRDGLHSHRPGRRLALVIPAIRSWLEFPPPCRHSRACHSSRLRKPCAGQAAATTTTTSLQLKLDRNSAPTRSRRMISHHLQLPPLGPAPSAFHPSPSSRHLVEPPLHRRRSCQQPLRGYLNTPPSNTTIDHHLHHRLITPWQGLRSWKRQGSRMICLRSMTKAMTRRHLKARQERDDCLVDSNKTRPKKRPGTAAGASLCDSHHRFATILKSNYLPFLHGSQRQQ